MSQNNHVACNCFSCIVLDVKRNGQAQRRLFMSEPTANVVAQEQEPRWTLHQGEIPSLERQWLSYREAEMLTGLSRTTLWRLIVKEGSVKHARIGRAVRISRSSLEAYMDGAAADLDRN
jgi:excisionase family DNA binding protein